MPRTRTAAAGRAAAATAEVERRHVEATWRGLTFEVPARLPMAAVLDIKRGGTGLDEDKIVRVLESVLGVRQFDQVRDKLIEDEVPVDDGFDVLVELFEGVLGTYGMSLGESSASSSS